MILIEDENQLILYENPSYAKRSYCNFTIDDAIESFNNKPNGFIFFLRIFNDGEIYYSSFYAHI